MIETRQITQFKICKLILNQMTSNTENAVLVALSDDRDKLLSWYKSQLATEPYNDFGVNQFPAKGDFPESFNRQHKYYKVFKKDGPLEWYNPMDNEETPNYWGHGISNEWVNEDQIDSVKANHLFID